MTHSSKIITVLGAGSMGTALANVLAHNGHEVRLWDINQKTLDEINEHHTNRHFFPDLKLPHSIRGVSNIHEAIRDAELINVVVPSLYVRSTVKSFSEEMTEGQMVLNWAKGIEEKSLKFMLEVMNESTPLLHRHNLATISGPSLAKEIADKRVTAVNLTGRNQYILPIIKEIFEKGNDTFKMRIGIDTVGVELCGIMKNIYALLVGMAESLFDSKNTNAVILTASLEEMVTLGRSLGAYHQTFYDLCGMGDLIATCMSDHSRNRTMGKKLASGKTLKEALAEMTQVSEGVPATKTIHDLAKRQGVKLPIVEAMYSMLYEDKPLVATTEKLIKSLMA